MFDSEGRRSEKSNFVQTCNRLSRFMKEKGSLRDLNLEIGGKVESLEAIVKPGSTHGASASTTVDVLSDKGKSIEKHASMAINKLTSSKEEGQLTIFYSGRVLVFDECPTDKAKQVIAFAKKQTSKMSYGIFSNTSAPTLTSSPPCPRDGLPPRPLSVSPHPEAKGSGDLPIARRSSLNRFLEKRKDRAAVRGPYHRVEEQPAASSSSNDDQQLELRL